MRARYYSPDMRRFVNADIIAGEISEAVTLNRYAYANCNPVSNIDPFGLCVKEDKWAVHSDSAIYVVDYKYGPGLTVLGHTKLYFFGDDGAIYKTEFTGQFPDKSTAKVRFYKVSSETVLDDLERGKMSLSKLWEGTDYILLEGDFTLSLHIAKSIAEGQIEYPNYSLIGNSCLDYTNLLLDYAYIDNLFVSNYIKNDDVEIVPNSHISDLKYLQSYYEMAYSVMPWLFEHAVDSQKEKYFNYLNSIKDIDDILTNIMK